MVLGHKMGRERLWPLNPVHYSVAHSGGFHVLRLQHAVKWWHVKGCIIG